MTTPRQTDADLVLIDLPEEIRTALGPAGDVRRLFAEGAVAAAIQADRRQIEPPALAFLAEIIRRGGIDHAAGLSEPMPSAEQSVLVLTWLAAAAGHDADELFPRWLDAVAVILGARERARLSAR
jgi:hypothetical protein